MRHARSAVVVLTLLLGAGVPARAQEPAMETVLARARASYAAGQYDSTVLVLRAFVKKNGRDPANEQIVPLLLEALVRKNDIEYSPKLISIYLARFPSSAFAPRVRYLDGVVKARQEDYVGAVQAFSTAAASGLSPTLDSLVQINVRLLCEKSLAESELEQLASRTDLHPIVLEPVRYYWAAKLLQAGQTTAAERAATEFQKDYPKSVYAPLVRDLLNRSRSQQRGVVPVGVLVPLTGPDADLGKRIAQGVQLAVDRYNQSAGVKVNLVVTDTRGSSVETVLRARELVDGSRVPLILGPVHSQNAVACAAAVAERDVTMLTPTATEDGIADLGSNIFQLNVTMGTLGRRLAEYAMNNLNIREFAILAPLTDYGRVLSENFRDVVKKNGGTIVAEEVFDEGASDFRPQFQSLRNILIQRRVAREALESPSAFSKPQRSSYRSDSITYADSVMSVGGLFVPAEHEDVVMLAPQVAFFKLRTQLLGATGWHNQKTLTDGKQYVNNAMIVTAAETDPNDPQWREFRDQYFVRFNAEPDRVSALGYDAADVACKALSGLGASPSGKQIARALHGVQNYKGVSGMISFDPARGINREAAIVKISDKKFVRVQ